MLIKQLLLAVALSVASSFTIVTNSPTANRAFPLLATIGSDKEELNIAKISGRRDILSKVAGITTLSFLTATLPAFADVSDGNSLPDGAAQFNRVIRAKADMQTIAKRVTNGSSEMDKAEWNNVGGFLRKVYAVSEDMKSIANGFDAEKKKTAASLADDLKKTSKAADAPTGSQNGPEFLAYAKKIIGILDEFLDLMSDVPDEL